jgi:hypothetical protein
MKKHKLNLIQIHKASTKVLLNHFATLHPKAIKGEDFVYVPGSTRMPLLVAHADIIHPDIPQLILIDEIKGILSSPTGLGADDRAGVYAILTLWENLDPKPGMLLCDKEETGGIGAWNASYDIYDQLQEYPFYVEIDRKGSGECVFYNYEHQEFIDYIESFGFKEEYGIFSDITTLGTETKKCSVNLSAGYELAHTKGEYLKLDALNYTIKHGRKLMLSMLHNPPKDLRFRLPKPPKKEKLYGYSSFNHGYDSYNGYSENGRFMDDDLPDVDAYMKHPEKYDWHGRSGRYKCCDQCGSDAEVKYANLNYGHLCIECYRDWMDFEDDLASGKQ